MAKYGPLLLLGGIREQKALFHASCVTSWTYVLSHNHGAATTFEMSLQQAMLSKIHGISSVLNHSESFRVETWKAQPMRGLDSDSEEETKEKPEAGGAKSRCAKTSVVGGWLLGWWAGWLVGWLVGWLAQSSILS